MSDNDYIAEYIKEKRPELIGGMDFAVWKISRCVVEFGESVVKGLTALFSDKKEGEKY